MAEAKDNIVTKGFSEPSIEPSPSGRGRQNDRIKAAQA